MSSSRKQKSKKEERTFLFYIGLIVMVLVLILVNKLGYAEGRDIRLESSSVDIFKNTFRHDPYQPDLTGEWTYGGQFNLGIRFGDNLIWDNNLHLDGTESKVENAGWEFEFRYDRWQVQPFYYHHSEHSLESEGESGRFPQVDRIGVKLCLLGCFNNK